MITFIHCADLHLGRPLKTNVFLTDAQEQLVKGAAYRSFRKMVDDALTEQVDFVLIAGDLFDEEVRSLKGQWFIRTECERLNEAGIPVYISHGNHDPLRSDEAVGYPGNVSVFPPQSKTFVFQHAAGESVAISGFSYPEKAFTERAKDYFPSRRDDVTWHIGMLHGQEGSSKADHATYAPFNLAELREYHYDYWALGHIHKRMSLSEEPPVHYSGNMQGANRKESGKKGYLQVSLAGDVCHTSFKETAPVQYHTVLVDVTGTEQLEEVVQRFMEQVDDLPRMELIILTVLFHGETSRYAELITYQNSGELKELLEESLQLQDELVIDTIQTKELVDSEAAERLREDPLYQDLLTIKKTLEQKEDWLQDMTQELERNARYRKLSGQLDTEIEDKDIADEAFERITSALIQKEADQS